MRTFPDPVSVFNLILVTLDRLDDLTIGFLMPNFGSTQQV